MKQRIIFSLFISLFIFLSVHSQVKKTNQIDSTKLMYQKIENYSNKSKFRKFLYKLIFTPTQKKISSKSDFREKNDAEIEKNEGKIIRNIKIETLDPFGYSIENEERLPKYNFELFGNKIHLKTKEWTIRNLLLIKKNQTLDTYLLKESERLIRRQRYVRSVVIKTSPTEISKDSVDVIIRVLDSWSLIPNGAITEKRMNFEVNERNTFGLGHEFENDFGKQFTDGQTSYSGKYSYNNIKNTFINTSVSYVNSFNNDITKNIRIERPFFSPQTKFAAGVFFETNKLTDSLPTILPDFETYILKYETQDLWFGYATKLFKGKFINYRSTNFVTTFGYKNVNYIRRPILDLDPNQFFNDEELYLISMGVTTRKFIQDRYLFNFDIIEDVPIGKVYSLTSGIRNKNYNRQSYLGGRFSYGHYYSFGYLNGNIELGSFFQKLKNYETTLKIEANYFTSLMSLGTWKVRQFIKPAIVIGTHRDNSIKDRTYLKNINGFESFSNPLLNGTRKFTVVFQTQTYVPGTWNGFHFSPFFNSSLGFLGNKTNTFLENKLYSKFTLGVLINNDYLVFDRFQISFSYFPTIPYEGSNLIRTNVLNNDDFIIPDYIIGQPKIVDFR